MDNSTNNTKRVVVSFAAINPRLETNIVRPDEVKAAGKDWVSWGKNNDYPEYLLSLRRGAATLKAVIDGICDYVVGDKIEGRYPFSGKYVNRKRDTWRSFVRNLSRDWATYGALAYEVIRSAAGQVVELNWVDVRYIRTNEDRSAFWYSEDWAKRWGKKTDMVIPAYIEDATDIKSSLVYVTNTDAQVYGECPFEGAVIAAELERDIDEYHLNNMENGFTGSYIVNFNNGVPEDEVKEEIERQFNKKFSGHHNAGRIVFSWNDSRDSQTTLQELKTTDFSDRYNALSKRSRQQIFTAYRANPNLFGIPTESLGFSSEEYDAAFKLFNRCTVQPIQQTILAAIAVAGDWGVKITPFSLEGDSEGQETAQEGGAE